ncbi:MAG: 4'-phosphopantetheinyl transferase superfamily protein [Chloroflexi bacterium]|mgnify:FL=1|jgi:4'-phosphopantetheinyl transferase|nr:4'-phosphopantetheinyl transferase superfamily protein [Chloroflexota bacterium]MBT7484303.1 4'-phosphopantetheinyl transferase superfamily protein [Candidatus Peregrinibacteria bacterium]
MTPNDNTFWKMQPAKMILASDDVHIWVATFSQLRTSTSQLRNLLSADEIDRAKKIYTTKEMQRFIVARGILRIILGRYLNMQPKMVQFRYNTYGKPALTAGNLHFSLSRSDDIVICAITRGRKIGVDAEYICPYPEIAQVIERFFSSPEKDTVCAAIAPEKLKAFYTFWTLKEAYIKANGKGLMTPLEEVDSTFLSGESPVSYSAPGELQKKKQWMNFNLMPAPNYIASLVVEGDDLYISCREISRREIDIFLSCTKVWQ